MAAAGVEALTLSAPLGAFGVVYAPTDFPQPWFDERRAGVYPLYHVLRGIAQAAASRGSKPRHHMPAPCRRSRGRATAGRLSGWPI